MPLLAAAAVLVLVTRPGPGAEAGVTLKGTPFKVFMKRGDAASVALGADAVVQPGDALRFSYDAAKPGFLAVFDLDATEQVTVFFPYGGAGAAPVDAAQGLLPGSVVLDTQRGSEWLVAVWAPRPFDTAPLAAQLKGQSTRADLSLSCEGCVVSSLRLARGAR